MATQEIREKFYKLKQCRPLNYVENSHMLYFIVNPLPGDGKWNLAADDIQTVLQKI